MATTESTFAHVESHSGEHPHRRKRVLIGFATTIVAVIVAAVVIVLVWSCVSLTADATALAHVSVQPFGGSIEHVTAFGPSGRSIPIAVHDGRLTPLRQ